MFTRGDLCYTIKETADVPRDAAGRAILGEKRYLLPNNTVVEVQGQWKDYRYWYLCWVPNKQTYTALHMGQITLINVTI